ncbi:putative alpha,alpha-trehalose-phosphate synthase (UDP-forming) [Helianthus annuus]|nr:putative alpha,alpha-trehalose-phosphate synthase (UDP-forming) [Helianthus annuus]
MMFFSVLRTRYAQDVKIGKITGAILVNPWNITDVASSILYALDMPYEEREKRHNHNFMHVITHTCQKWAETFLRFDQSLDFNTLCALYAVADVALITSVMDGMNLVSYEFVACQASKKGVLVLSEFVGATQSLGAGAILVNQWNITDVASSILYALDMPYEEREKRHNHNFMHVITHTCQKLAETFLRLLSNLCLLFYILTRIETRRNAAEIL